jgi:hypothetical protein
MENLLYYPYINIPNTDWTARVLLYYDQVGSIVPQSFFYEPDNYDPFMKKMVRNELIRPIDPMGVLDSPSEVSKPFIQYVNSKEFKLKKRLESFNHARFGRIQKDNFSVKGVKFTTKNLIRKFSIN